MSSSKRIYFDHAATSYPKPDGVLEAVQNYFSHCGASAGRGAYQEAFQARDILEKLRTDLCHFIGASVPSRLIFTFNASEALNVALKGILKSGDHVLCSSLEHNSVSRPLNKLRAEFGIEFDQIPVGLNGEIDFSLMEKKLKPNTRLLAFIHGSNVSGTLLPLQQLGDFSYQRGMPLLVDASQTLGAYPIDVLENKISMLAFPGHKSLLGPLGTGGLWVREDLELKTLKEGGTGSASEADIQPSFWPDIHESGSHNLMGLVGLAASLQFIKKTGLQQIRQHKLELISVLLDGLSKLSNIKVIAAKAANNAGVVSIQHAQLSPNDFAILLDQKFRIQGRPGIHCAPWAHQTFGTYPKGTLRLSLGYSNTLNEVEFVLDALSKIA